MSSLRVDRIPAIAEFSASRSAQIEMPGVLAPAGCLRRERAVRLAGLALSAIILIAVSSQFRSIQLDRIAAMAPGLSIFWPAFILFYLLTPLAEWLIYRRMWRLPVAGLMPLLRKQVANELVLGYSGEAQFYLWARRYGGVAGSPFGVIKDVAILSAVAGNVSAVAMMALMAPWLLVLLRGTLGHAFASSIVIAVVGSLVPLLLRRTLFSRARRDLQLILYLHFLRIALGILLSAFLWHLLVPGIPFGWLIALATVRMMVSRLPLIPGKDILFAGMAVLLFGRNADPTAAIALMTSLLMATNLVVGIVTGLAGLWDRPKKQ